MLEVLSCVNEFFVDLVAVFNSADILTNVESFVVVARIYVVAVLAFFSDVLTVVFFCKRIRLCLGKA